MDVQRSQLFQNLQVLKLPNFGHPPYVLTEIVVSEADSDTEDDTIEEVMKTPENNKVTVEATEKVVEKTAIEDMESDESKELTCDKCAFVGKTLAGLKTHQTTKHKNYSGRKSLFTII